MTSKGSLGDYIMVDPDDAPAIDELECAADVLRRCANLYRTVRGRRDPPPEPIDIVASFLETFILKYKKQLHKKSDKEKK